MHYFNSFLRINGFSQQERFEVLQKKAANFYIAKNNPVQSINHAIKSGDNALIGQLLSDTGASLVKSGQFDWLLDTIKSLPKAIRDTFYPLYFFEGEAHRYRAFYEKARQAYNSCLRLAEGNNDSYFLSRANAGIAHIYSVTTTWHGRALLTRGHLICTKE